jgi:hypothetical protein
MGRARDRIGVVRDCLAAVTKSYRGITFTVYINEVGSVSGYGPAP